MIQTWFSTPLYYVDLNCGDNNLKSMLDWIENNVVIRDTKYATTGDSVNQYTLHNNPEFQWLNSQVSIHCKSFLTQCGCNLENINLYAQKSWAVISKKNSLGVSPHIHPNSVLSAVFYLQSNMSGNIKFSVDNPLQRLPLKLNSCNLSYKYVEYEPLVNRLMIFPSNVYHEVMKNTSDIDRISVTYDITVTCNDVEDSENLILDPSLWKQI